MLGATDNGRSRLLAALGDVRFRGASQLGRGTTGIGGEADAIDVRVWTPLRMQEVFRGAGAQVQVLPCVRPVGAAVHTPLACMEFADRVQNAFARSRRLDTFPGFPSPVSLTVAPYLSLDLPAP